VNFEKFVFRANLIITRILMMLPSVSLGFLLCSMAKKTGVLTPEKRVHPPGGILFFTSSRDHIALRAKSYKESSRFGKYILKEISFSEIFGRRGEVHLLRFPSTGACGQARI
jgi:hypothetical protein